MKRFAGWTVSALLTFTIGISIPSSRYLSSIIFGGPDQSGLPKSVPPQNASLSAWLIITSFENQDLTELNQQSKAKLEGAIDALLGKRERQFLFPRMISKISNSQGESRYVLIEESPLWSIPGESSTKAHVFNLQGKLLSSSSFSTGWRIAITGVNIIYAPQVGRQVFVVSTEPVIGGRDVAREYYALIGEKLGLIRLEDSNGEVVRNRFGAIYHPIGPVVQGRSAQAWKEALESDDTAELMAVLTWLSGDRWNIRKYVPDYGNEDLKEDGIADEVRSSVTFRVAMIRLMASDNAWVRRAAELAMNVEYYNSRY